MSNPVPDPLADPGACRWWALPAAGLSAAAGVWVWGPGWLEGQMPGVGGPVGEGIAFAATAAAGASLVHAAWACASRNVAAAAAAAMASPDGTIHVPCRLARPLVRVAEDVLATGRGVAESARDQARRDRIQLKVVSLAHEQLSAMLAHLEDAAFVVDPEEEVRFCNHVATRLLGVTDAVGEAVTAVVRDETLLQAVGEAVRDLRNSRRPGRRTFEHVMSDAGGDTRQYRVTLLSVPHGSGPAAGGSVAVLLRDVSREHQLNHSKNEFVHGVTHELRTPLSSIRAYAEMLVDAGEADAAAVREYADIILTEAQRLGQLIDDILNVARIESGMTTIDRQPQSLAVLAEKALEVIVPQARLKHIDVTRELAPSTRQVEGDANLLYQVILNLLSNAVKYTPEGGKVRIAVNVDEARQVCVLKVIDTGAGIPAEDVPKMFTKFFRVKKNAGMAKGTGLGLPLVKRVVEQDHEGRVFFDSVEGRGSTFGFELPLLNAASAAPAAPARAA